MQQGTLVALFGYVNVFTRLGVRALSLVFLHDQKFLSGGPEKQIRNCVSLLQGTKEKVARLWIRQGPLRQDLEP